MHEQTVRRYFFFALFLVGAALTIFILWPFAKVIILSIALSAVLFPLYKLFKKYLKVSWVSSLLTVFVFLVVLCIPLFILGTLVFKQSQSIYGWVVNHGGLDNMTSIFNKMVQNIFPGGSIDFSSSVTNFVGNLTKSIGVAFTTTLSTLFSLLLVVLGMFYFLKDGINWKQILIHFSPLSDESGEKILKKLDSAVNGIVKGYILIAIVQGLLMGLGLAIFHVPNAALWGMFTAIASMIPTVGTALVSIPAVMFLFVAGHNGAAIGLAIWAAALVGTIDNFLNPYFVGKKIDIHPLLVLFSVLGGIILMGPIGILVGPLTISFMYALSSVYKAEIKS